MYNLEKNIQKITEKHFSFIEREYGFYEYLNHATSRRYEQYERGEIDYGTFKRYTLNLIKKRYTAEMDILRNASLPLELSITLTNRPHYRMRCMCTCKLDVKTEKGVVSYSKEEGYGRSNDADKFCLSSTLKSCTEIQKLLHCYYDDDDTIFKYFSPFGRDILDLIKLIEDLGFKCVNGRITGDDFKNQVTYYHFIRE